MLSKWNGGNEEGPAQLLAVQGHGVGDDLLSRGAVSSASWA